jgi:hypothetical protein
VLNPYLLFRLIRPAALPGPTLLNSNCACLKGNLYLFGGTAVTEGPDFGYIWCSFDLQASSYRQQNIYDKEDNLCVSKVI